MAESLERLRSITGRDGQTGTTAHRASFASWVANAIEARNVAGLADASRKNLYPLDLDVLVERHALLGMSRSEMVSALPALRGATCSGAAVTPIVHASASSTI